MFLVFAVIKANVLHDTILRPRGRGFESHYQCVVLSLTDQDTLSPLLI